MNSLATKLTTRKYIIPRRIMLFFAIIYAIIMLCMIQECKRNLDHKRDLYEINEALRNHKGYLPPNCIIYKSNGRLVCDDGQKYYLN